MTEDKEPNFITKLRAMIADGTITDGMVLRSEISHDDWCAMLQVPPGICNCDPQIDMVEIDEIPEDAEPFMSFDIDD